MDNAGFFFLGVKRPGSEANHTFPTSTEIKNTWIYPSTSPYIFIALCAISEAQVQLYLYESTCLLVKMFKTVDVLSM
jgi:hypothetical protein